MSRTFALLSAFFESENAPLAIKNSMESRINIIYVARKYSSLIQWKTKRSKTMSTMLIPGMGSVEIWDLHVSFVFKRWLHKHEKPVEWELKHIKEYIRLKLQNKEISENFLNCLFGDKREPHTG